MTHARATWIDNFRFESVSSSNHSLVMDGDKTTASSPMELVLMALCGCTGYDVVAILKKKREPLAGLEVRAEAVRAEGPPSAYTAIHLTYRVRGEVTPKSVEDAVRLSKEKYCSVSAMLQKTAEITSAIEYDQTA